MSKFPTTVKKEKSKRILTFDLLRGYFLCVILFNHLEYYPSGLGWITGKGFLYVSTAEGFFLVSGIVLGIVRGRKLLNQPFKVAAKLLWKRALQLYVTSIVLSFLFTFIGQLFIGNPGLKYGIYTDWNNWWELLWHTINLSYSYGWADFLRLYAIFLFFAPIALWLLRKGWWYALVLISAIVWSLYPLLPDDPIIAQPFSWQFIFFSGLVVGYYWEKIVAQWRKLSIRWRKTIGWSFVGVFIVTVIATYLLVFGHEIDTAFGAQLAVVHHTVEQYFNKDRLPIPRLLLGTIWFWALFFLARRFESWIMKYFGRLLVEFGMNSLYVYTISAFVIFFMNLIIAPPGLGNLLLNLLLSLIGLGIVYLALKTKFLMKIIPR
ncbi:MAG: OpgC domain-containing protein [Candidatus Saccharimonadaceae bacterium]